MKSTAESARFYAALADPTRLRLLNLIEGREICVCHLVDVLGQGQPKISRHLAYLRREGLVSARREGKWMHYRLIDQLDPQTGAILKAVLAGMAGDPLLMADRVRLQKLLSDQLVSLQPAPAL